MTPRNAGKPVGARITLSALALCAVAAMLAPPRAAAEEVPVGAVFAVTGELQALEAPSAKGAQLFFAQNPDTGLRLDLIDSGADVPGIKDKVAALLDDNPGMAAVFGLTFTEGALLAAQAAEADDVVFLTSGAPSPKLPFEVPGYLYMAAFGDNVQAAAAAEFAAQRLGAQSAAVLYDRRHVYTTLLEGYFRGSFEAQGGSIASVTGFDGPDALEEVLGSLQTSDIVFLSAETADEAAAAVATLRAHGVTQPVIGGDGYDADWFREALQHKGIRPCIPGRKKRKTRTNATSDSTSGTTWWNAASTRSRMLAESPLVTTRRRRAYLASSTSRQSGCGSAICQHDLTAAKSATRSSDAACTTR